MTTAATTNLPGLPTFLPPNRIPVADMSMQKILSRAIRNHAKAGNTKNFAVKGADKMGGKRGSSKGGSKRGAGKTSPATKTK